MKKENIVVIVGPTASGKTSLGIALAKQLNGEIISADSMQVYAGLDLVTAKPKKEEMEGIPHHFLGFLPMDQECSVADFVDFSKKTIQEIIQRGKLPIIVGGTGLYIDCLLYNVQFEAEAGDTVLRNCLQEMAVRYGKEYLHQILREIDSEFAQKIHYNNQIRVIRSLEIYLTTGMTPSAYQGKSLGQERLYHSVILGLNFEHRQVLYDRINQRVEGMLEEGLVQEAKLVYENEKVSQTAKQAIGYKELFGYFQHQTSLKDCVEQIKQNSRRYAKRQLTWFRKNHEIQWFYLDKCSMDEVLEQGIVKIKKGLK